MFRTAPFFTSFITIRDLNPERGNEEREENSNGFSGRANFRIISTTTYSSNGQRNNIEFAPQPTINSDEIRETIAQNLVEVQNMIDFVNYNEFN